MKRREDATTPLIRVIRPPGDYSMDLRRLRAGEVDAAYLGSTVDPAQIAAEEGFHELAWVGDHLAIPTVGLAVDPAVVPLEDPAVAAAVRAQRRALSLLAADEGLSAVADELGVARAPRAADVYRTDHVTP